MITPRSPLGCGAFLAIAAAARRSTLNVPTRLIVEHLAEQLEVVRHALLVQRALRPADAGAAHRGAQRRRGSAAAIAACTSLGRGDVGVREAAVAPSSAASAAPFFSSRSTITTLAPAATSLPHGGFAEPRSATRHQRRSTFGCASLSAPCSTCVTSRVRAADSTLRACSAPSVDAPRSVTNARCAAQRAASALALVRRSSDRRTLVIGM